MIVRCKYCNAEDSIYERVTVECDASYDGSVEMIDGKPEWERQGRRDMDTHVGYETFDCYACDRCDKTVMKIEDIAQIQDEALIDEGSRVTFRDAFGISYERRVTEVTGHGSLRRYRLEFEGYREFTPDQLTFVPGRVAA